MTNEPLCETDGILYDHMEHILTEYQRYEKDLNDRKSWRFAWTKH